MSSTPQPFQGPEAGVVGLRGLRCFGPKHERERYVVGAIVEDPLSHNLSIWCIVLRELGGTWTMITE